MPIKFYVWLLVASVLGFTPHQERSHSNEGRKILEIESNLFGDTIADEIKSISREAGLSDVQKRFLTQVLEKRLSKVDSLKSNKCEVDIVFFRPNRDGGAKPIALRKFYSGLTVKVTVFPSGDLNTNAALYYCHVLNMDGSSAANIAEMFRYRNNIWKVVTD